MPTYLGDPLVVESLQTPAAPTLTKRGATGAVTYSYKVVGVRGLLHTAASATASVTNGVTPLTILNNIAIRPSLVAGVDHFDIYRIVGGDTQGKIGTLLPTVVNGVQVGIFIDTGKVGDAASAPTVQNTGQVTLQGPILASGLPAADPAVAGALWVDASDGHTIKVSQGA